MEELGPVGARVQALSRRRTVRSALALAAIAGVLSPLVPLANVPSYESALFANVLVGLLGGLLGIVAARLEREAERGTAPAPVERSPAALTAVGRATGAALVLTLLAALPVLLAALVVGAIGAACSLTAGLAWYPVLPLASAPLAAAAGVLCGAALERWWACALLYGGVLVASLAGSAWPILTGPQVYFYNHLLGYLPGPLYDEALVIEQPLLAYRVLTLAWALSAVALAALCWRGGRLGLPAWRPLSAGLLAAGVAAVSVGHAARSRIGYEQSFATVHAALGARTEGERCSLIHPREMRLVEVRRAAGECDLRVHQLEEFFGLEAPRPVIFLHRSSEEKRRLVGAGGTQFAKPWLHQLHVDRRGWPHPVLKHELAHLVTVAIGRGPWGTAATLGGVVPIPALVEGAAVAADWPGGELTIHEQARAMKDLGLAPDLQVLLAPQGFFAESQRRAYTSAGSFVRWLVETRGAERFARAFSAGDFAGAYGEELPVLVQQWRAFLDTVELPARARAVAERRFRRPAIFRRPCAREVAQLLQRAEAALVAEDGPRAAELYERCYELDAGDPSHLRSRATALAREGDAEAIRTLGAELEAHPAVDDVIRADLLSLLGDAHVAREEYDAARASYLAASRLTNDRSGERMLAVKVEAMQDPEIARAVLPFLAEGSDAKLIAVRDLLERRPEYSTGFYLVGRRLQQRDEDAVAVLHLDRALAGKLPSPAIEREARKQRALALLALGRYADACPELEHLAHEGEPGERLEAEDLLAICRYDAGRRTAAR